MYRPQRGTFFFVRCGTWADTKQYDGEKDV